MNTKESFKKETAVNMSEYLYRGMRIDTREWVYGYLVVHNDGIVDNKVHSIFTGHSGFGFNEGLNFEWHEVIPETVGRFTGFFDKSCWDNLPEKERNTTLLDYKKETWKGRKIFERDVLEVIMEDSKPHIMTVKIQDGKVMLFDQHGFGRWIGEFSDMIIVNNVQEYHVVVENQFPVVSMGKYSNRIDFEEVRKLVNHYIDKDREFFDKFGFEIGFKLDEFNQGYITLRGSVKFLDCEEGIEEYTLYLDRIGSLLLDNIVFHLEVVKAIDTIKTMLIDSAKDFCRRLVDESKDEEVQSFVEHFGPLLGINKVK